VSFEAKRRENGVKKRKIGFYKHVLELLFASIPGQPTQVVKSVVPLCTADHARCPIICRSWLA